jgi:manganese transport protein
LGLLMLVFAVATIKLHPDWKAVGAGLIPQIPAGLSSKQLLVFAYFVIAIVSAVLFPYETYFYSSGGIEENWGPKDLKINFLTTTVGFGFGSLVAVALLINSAVLFGPLHIDPQLPGTVALQAAIPFGRPGLTLALLGMLFAIAGAAVETGMSGGYCVAQFFGWQWGRYRTPDEVPRFTLAWLVSFAIGLAVVLSGIDPLQLVEWSILFSVVVLPLSYLPVILIANDRKYMRSHVNGRFGNALGWSFYFIIILVAVAAIPLYLLTSGGQI